MDKTINEEAKTKLTLKGARTAQMRWKKNKRNRSIKKKNIITYKEEIARKGAWAEMEKVAAQADGDCWKETLRVKSLAFFYFWPVPSRRRWIS